MINEHLVQQVRKGDACIENEGSTDQLQEVLGICFPYDWCDISGFFKYYFIDANSPVEWDGSNTLPSGMVAIPLDKFFEQEEKDFTVKEDMVCPATGEHCDDECCTVGSWCNVSSDKLSNCSPPKQEVDKVEGEKDEFIEKHMKVINAKMARNRIYLALYDAYDQGFKDAMESDSPNKSQYIKQAMEVINQPNKQ